MYKKVNQFDNIWLPYLMCIKISTKMLARSVNFDTSTFLVQSQKSFSTENVGDLTPPTFLDKKLSYIDLTFKWYKNIMKIIIQTDSIRIINYRASNQGNNPKPP